MNVYLYGHRNVYYLTLKVKFKTFSMASFWQYDWLYSTINVNSLYLVWNHEIRNKVLQHYSDYFSLFCWYPFLFLILFILLMWYDCKNFCAINFYRYTSQIHRFRCALKVMRPIMSSDLRQILPLILRFKSSASISFLSSQSLFNRSIKSLLLMKNSFEDF